MPEVKVANLEKLKEFWFSFLPQVKKSEVLFLFDGELGSGKTTSVSMICDYYKTVAKVSSPSFGLMQSYALPSTSGILGESFQSIEHVDLYRLDDEDDFESSGFWDLFQQKHVLVVVEWAKKIPQENLPLDFATYHFHFVQGKISWHGQSESR